MISAYIAIICHIFIGSLKIINYYKDKESFNKIIKCQGFIFLVNISCIIIELFIRNSLILQNINEGEKK